MNFSYTKSELLAILFQKSIVEMKNQKMQQDKVAQLKMFNYQQELIKNQMLPKTNVYFQVVRENRTDERTNPSDSMMEFFNKSQPTENKGMKS